ncbi:MAG: hypothetical protein MUF18_12965 [Fimbriiglobus sp.]|jgi:hypothetical protein|nr:hypothetical protein [Fimbriiglobus sp.]
MSRGWFFVVPLVCVVGCGFPAAKLDEARGHVQKGLEAWKAGGKSADLRPVEFHEVMWENGEKLMSFEMGQAKYAESAQAVRVEVKLTVRNKKGKERVENVTYDVTLGPPVKVVFNPMP